jgi:ribosomal protein S6--L-glutamate ligase
MSKVKQIILSFHPCFTAGYQIILGDRRLASRDHRWIQRADAIILHQSCSQELYRACKDSGAQVFPNYDMKFRYPGKLGQARLFQEFHVKHPETMSWSSAYELREFIRKGGKLCHPFPFLMKANQSHEGEGISVVSDPDSLERALNILASWEKTGQSGFISQEMVQTDGNVLRAVILGEQTITYWKRPNKAREPVTTLSRNAIVDRDWRKDLQGRGRFEAGRICERTGINLAAMDFVFSMADSDPQPFCLDINYYFGRRGLGGLLNYYGLLHRALQDWLKDGGFDPGSLRLL